MNLNSFKYFSTIYFVILILTIIISLFIKNYDFLLGVYIFIVPILVLGSITTWFKLKNLSIFQKVAWDILFHWIPFLSFIFVLFFFKLKINNKILFWSGYLFIILSLIIYFIIHSIKGVENIYKSDFTEIIIIYTSILLPSTFIIYRYIS